jgi:hypothetical protein
MPQWKPHQTKNRPFVSGLATDLNSLASSGLLRCLGSEVRVELSASGASCLSHYFLSELTGNTQVYTTAHKPGPKQQILHRITLSITKSAAESICRITRVDEEHRHVRNRVVL